jgi:uncharacterized membrane-anchored protein YitT (DUF2179 family)
VIKHLKVYLNIFIGVLCIAVAYYFLFLPLNIVTGGVTGIAIILSGIFKEGFFSSSLLILILNILFLVIGLIFLGKEFFIKTLFGSIFLPLIIGLFEVLQLPPDYLFTIDNSVLNVVNTEMNYISRIILAVILGSILTGVGLGLCFRVNATTGGMDIVQKIIAKYLHIPYSKTVYFTDGIVVVVALLVFGVEMTMYNLISIYLIGIFVDLIHMGGASRRTVFILSKKNEEIKEVIINRLGRGVTVVPANGGYSGDCYEMLICTLSRNESYLLKDLICEIDSNAFTFFVSAKEVYGDGF